MDIGETIAKYRKLKNLTQSELAEKLGVHQSQIAHWEKGRSKPREESLEQIAEAFEIEIEELLSGGPHSFETIEDSELKALLFQVTRLSKQQQQALKIVLADMVQISQFQAMMEARAS
ncbi:MAG: helix-turn-helix transcriptional regulator [Vulcanimicrobiota bacterium]